jgi:hypothetical protein
VRVLEKINGTGIRLLHIFWLLPIRIGRLGRHVFYGIFYPEREKVILPMNRFLLWWINAAFLVLDILAVPELYEIMMVWSKWQTRGLTPEERKLARSIYGDSIFYDRVLVDETAKIICEKHHIFYVSFFTINSWGTFQPDIFIHELMHVWQFQKMGSVYIPLALLAQRTTAGYNYGGFEKLMEVIIRNGDFDDFNLEQQADIVSDYYCMKVGQTPRWCEPYKLGAFEALQFFVDKLSK